MAEHSTVARLVSDVLARNRNNPDFEISVSTCSITYMYVLYLSFQTFSHWVIQIHMSRHRQHFRSDVLVSFHPPMTFTPKVSVVALCHDYHSQEPMLRTIQNFFLPLTLTRFGPSPLKCRRSSVLEHWTLLLGISYVQQSSLRGCTLPLGRS